MTRDTQATNRIDSDRAQPRTTRRNVVKAIGAGTAAVSLGIGIGAGSASADVVRTAPYGMPRDEFVEVDGTEFVIDDQPIYFNGANNFWITHEYDGTKERIDDVLDLYRDLGINLVRIWAHGEGKEGPLALQPEPGAYNEDALENLDYLIDAARERNMRIIATLVDNWVHEGGMAQYASWVTGDEFDPDSYEYPEGLHEVFYTDPEARELYKNHVETILTRENTYTGYEWREDPTIMMWELANEPRLEQDWAYDGEFEGDEHSEILGDWIQEMSAFVKDLDDNHLVSTGSEGHYRRSGESYPDGTWGGQDFVEHHSYDTIDAASFHLYPDPWNLSLDDGEAYIRERLVDATEELEMPAYLGEFNVDAQEHDLETRNRYLEDWYAVADAYDANAVLPWQVVLDDTQDHDGAQLYRDESGYIIEDYADVIESKSGSWSNTTAPTGIAEDSTGDGLLNDFDGDGQTTHDDVEAFFEHIDDEVVQDNPDYFDFDGDGSLGFGDVVDLLRRV